MKRRTVLQLLLSTVGAAPANAGLKPRATNTAVARALRPATQKATLSSADVDRIRILGEVVLPQELGTEGRAQAVTSFLGWLRDYRPGVDTDHGYGFPRLRRTAPSPAAKYAAQLDALELEARKRGRDFKDTARIDQQTIVEAAITAAKIERLPSRPDGGHVATDLMAFFFDSVEANDLCYRARIGRDTCRTLDGSGDRPSPLGAREG